MVDDGLEHLSKKTRERAFILARNAKNIGLPLGKVRFTPHLDYMSYYLTDGSDYIIIFCTPDGYLAEVWHNWGNKPPTTSFFGIRNIRHFLQYVLKDGFKDIDDVGNEETDLRSYLEDIDDESS